MEKLWFNDKNLMIVRYYLQWNKGKGVEEGKENKELEKEEFILNRWGLGGV